MKIGNKVIDQQTPTYIIAEIGVNHNGDLALAKKSIDAAVETGADAVKFQTFKSEKLVSKHARQAKYQETNTGKSESQLEMLKRLELSHEDHLVLRDYCEEKGIHFLSTPFDEDSAQFLQEIGVHAFKIGSGDVTNIPLLKKIGSFGIPVILSSGMCSMGELELAIEALGNTEVALLHCTSVYPAPLEDVNLRVITAMDQAFHKVVGYSDHTLGYEVTVAAVVLGAKIIEKHFTLDKNLPGPDHKASLNPSEFGEMVRAVRNVELSLGDGIKRCMPSELDTREVARKSLVALRTIEPGETLSIDNLGIKRPGTGIEPKFFEQLLGKPIKRKVEEDQVITWDDLI